MNKLKKMFFVMSTIMLGCGMVGANAHASANDTSISIKDIELNSEMLMDLSEVKTVSMEPCFAEVIPESVIGSDDRIHVVNTTQSPYSAICFVKATFPNNKTYIGTAWLYGNDVAATAAHVVYSSSKGGWATSVKLYAGNNGATTPFGEVTAKKIAVPVAWQTEGNANYDYAALTLNTNIGDRTGWFGVAVGGNNLSGTKVTVTGYPSEKAGQLWTASGDVVYSTNEQLWYNTDTTGGESGSPVYGSDMKAVAIHAYGGTSSNSGARINTTIYQFLEGMKQSVDQALAGDWNGDGKDTIATRRGSVFYIKNTLTGGTADLQFAYGKSTDDAISGDWNGDGKDTIAIRRGTTFHIKNTLSGGASDYTFDYGKSTDEVLVGDWDGDGKDTIAIRRGNVFHIKNTLSGGAADYTFNFGKSTDEVLVGDWNGDGKDTIAVRRGNIFHIKNSLSDGAADLSFDFGKSSDEALAGDWNGDGKDSLAVKRGNIYYIKNSLSSGAADGSFVYSR